MFFHLIDRILELVSSKYMEKEKFKVFDKCTDLTVENYPTTPLSSENLNQVHHIFK